MSDTMENKRPIFHYLCSYSRECKDSNRETKALLPLESRDKRDGHGASISSRQVPRWNKSASTGGGGVSLWRRSDAEGKSIAARRNTWAIFREHRAPINSAAMRPMSELPESIERSSNPFTLPPRVFSLSVLLFACVFHVFRALTSKIIFKIFTVSLFSSLFLPLSSCRKFFSSNLVCEALLNAEGFYYRNWWSCLIFSIDFF